MTARAAIPHTEGERLWLLQVYVVAVLINYPWERAQSLLYVGPAGSTIEWWLCMLASLADGLLVLLIFWFGRIMLRRHDWCEHPGFNGYLFMAGTGVVVSLVVEWVTVYLMQWWTYSERMPLVPGLGVGVAPLAQMLLLPPFIFYLVVTWNRWRMGSRSQAFLKWRGL